MTEKKAVRLFVGAPISVDCAEALRKQAETLAQAAEAGAQRIRWVAPANYHITLKFLGWVKPEVEPALRDRIGEALADARPFRFEVKGLGAFPRPSSARVLWAGVEDSGEMAPLASAIDEACESLGFAREKRAFHAHVTLGRAKKVADVRPLFVDSEHSYSEVACESVILYQSTMKSTGSEYSERWVWPLGQSLRQRSDLEPDHT